MLKLKLQHFGHLMGRADSLEKTLMLGKTEGRRRRGQPRMRWLDGITGLNGHEFEQDLGVGDGQGGLVCCSPWGCKESDGLSDWTELKHYSIESSQQPYEIKGLPLPPNHGLHHASLQALHGVSKSQTLLGDWTTTPHFTQMQTERLSNRGTERLSNLPRVIRW